ncbi:MAG: hypothetical protein ACP5G8_04775 [Athalassotoga sp.]
MRLIDNRYYFTAIEAGEFLKITNRQIMKIGRQKGWIEQETNRVILKEYNNEYMAGVAQSKMIDIYTRVNYLKHYFSANAIREINNEYNLVDEFDLDYNIRRKIKEYIAIKV